MASEKQIAANRANAKRSTGPRSAVGKLKSSRNAYRHGLSCPIWFDRVASAKVEALTRLLVGEGASGQQLAAAAEFVEAQLELLRIPVRREMNEKIDLNLSDRGGSQRSTATNGWPIRRRQALLQRMPADLILVNSFNAL